MIQLKDLLSRMLLATLLMFGSAQAWAGPVYSVRIDTASLGNGPAYLGLYFMGLANAAEASATVAKLSGALAGAPAVTGTVGGTLPGPLVFSNANGGSDYVQAVTLGGLFSFDLSFVLGEGDAGTTFGWALFDDVGYLGAASDLGTVSVNPGADLASMYVLDDLSTLSGVTVVPEPSTVALLLIAGLAFALRARRS